MARTLRRRQRNIVKSEPDSPIEFESPRKATIKVGKKTSPKRGRNSQKRKAGSTRKKTSDSESEPLMAGVPLKTNAKNTLMKSVSQKKTVKFEKVMKYEELNSNNFLSNVADYVASLFGL